MTNVQGNIDELTGLDDLVAFHRWLAGALQEHHGVGTDQVLTLVYFNVQNFKGYNEHYGFEAGNELLVLVAEAICDSFENCKVGRLGADQFIVAATDMDVVDGIMRVRAAFRSHHKDSSIWLKAGFYSVQPDDHDPGVVCDRAKSACDAIKGRRDIFYREYDYALKHEIMLHRYVLDHFEEALENHWIKIYYQPIVRVATGEVCDEEALARWVDPVEGIISPADFIPVLEEARIIHKLDLYMVRRACENFAKLAEMGVETIPVSMNLSRVDFELCDIVSEVQEILAEFNVSHELITIEVTESALTNNQEFLRSEIDRFRAAGFEVWIDDFGSGYSSLGTLKEYACDLVKIDMAFLDRFEDDARARVMLAHVISMTKELGMKTLVEGVETEEQFSFLRGIGCGRAQGYLLGRPASLDESASAIARKLYPKMETYKRRSFYEDIGRVNLMRPNPKESNFGSYNPSDVAVAIVRRSVGVFQYLNTSDLFVKFLLEIGSIDVEDSERAMNDPLNPRRINFKTAFDRCLESGDWESYTIPAPGKLVTVNMRVISYVPDQDAAAVLVIVE